MSARTGATIVCALLLHGCAFFGKSDPLTYRYYSVDRSAPTAAVPVAAGEPGLALRLGRVLAAQHLRERVAYQKSSRELGFYDERRWTERPEAYLERALSRALFEEARLTHVVSGPAPTLDLELLEFTEVRGATRSARVAIRALLSDGRAALLQRTFLCEKQAAGEEDDFDPVVNAISAALDECVQHVSQAVLLSLRTQLNTTTAGAVTADAGVQLANEHPQ